MKRLFFVLVILIAAVFFAGCSVFRPVQKSRLLPVFHLIEGGRFNEARGVVEDLIGNEESASWPRTWYARGLLSHNAWREGIAKNDRKLTELYPGQLYVAFESYVRADSLDKGRRLSRQLRPRYVMLANDFLRFGERQFAARNFNEALRAFEHSLLIAQRPELKVSPDTNLIFNAALAAFEGKNWNKAVKHLGQLHSYRFSANTTHLLFNAYLAKGDTLRAENVMIEGIEAFPDNENMVLLLADLYSKTNQYPNALEILDEAIIRSPENFVFHNTKGLIFQKLGRHEEAIAAYLAAHELAPENLLIPVNIATCYYNIGVEIERNSLSITNIRLVMVEREKSGRAFQSALNWLNLVYEANPTDQGILMSLLDLYRALRINDKVISLEGKLH